MKKLFFLLIFGICTISLASASLNLCNDVNDISEIPCIVSTPYVNCSDNATITNLETNINYTMATIPLTNGTYEFIFNYSIPQNHSIGTYQIRLCDGTQATLQVQYNWFGFYLFLFIMIPFVLIIIDCITDDRIFKMLAGFSLISIAILFIRIGYPTFNSQFISNLITISYVGIGGYLLTTGLIESLYMGGEE